MSGEKLNWTVDNTGKLIELYREHALLWDAGNKEHKNRYKRADALKEMGKCLNVSTKEVERKLKNINTQYQREIRIYKSQKKSGAGASFHSKWFGYELMSFLKNKNKPKKEPEAGLLCDPESCESSSGNEVEEPVVLETDREDENIDNRDSQVVDRDIQDLRSEINFQNRTSHTKTASSAKTSSESKKNVPRNNNYERSEEVYRMLQLVYQERRPQILLDDFDLYGETVVRKLRKLRTPYAQITVQHLIDNLLYNAQMGTYDEPQNNPRVEHEQEAYARFPLSPASSSAALNLPNIQPNLNVLEQTSTKNEDSYDQQDK